MSFLKRSAVKLFQLFEIQLKSGGELLRLTDSINGVHAPTYLVVKVMSDENLW